MTKNQLIICIIPITKQIIPSPINNNDTIWRVYCPLNFLLILPNL